MLNPVEMVGNGLRKVFGTRNDRLLKRYARVVEQITALETELRSDYDARFAERAAALKNAPPAATSENEPPVDPEAQLHALRIELSADLREKSAALKARAADGEPMESLLAEAFALTREASRRSRAHRHFDCQLVGGQVLFEGKVAEMKTGEGKTIVCHTAAFLRHVLGKKVHIVTVNDYLVQRDALFARSVFELLGMTVGYIQSQVDPGGYQGLRHKEYDCDITYGTNNEFGFDYLRDNMKIRRSDQCQGALDYAIIDEVDSILIDEARTPLIISGAAADDVGRYRTANSIAMNVIERQKQANRETAARLAEWGDNPPAAWARNPKFADALKKFRTDPYWINEDEAEAIAHKQFFVVARERRSAHMTHDGVTVAQEALGQGSLYVGANMEWPHLIENAIRAHIVYERDVEYVVKEGEVVIVDEFTGRLMVGRQWSDGLHQAVEAKEGVRIKEETQTLATITLQNFFKLYGTIAGMTGTAMTEADEFMKIYKLDVVAIPTNRPVNRADHNDRIYKTVDDKFRWIVDEVHDIRTAGRPVDMFALAGALGNLRKVISGDAENVARIDAALKTFDDGAGDFIPMKEVFSSIMNDISHGRPVLVGTTSIENSEKLSNLLTRRYGIDHEVLNAKQHAREAEIVAKAGQRTRPEKKGDKPFGHVTIATNMAGRGTDIKLEKGVVHANCVGDLGAPAAGGNRKWAWHESGVTGTKCCVSCPDYDARSSCAHCWKPKIDPRFPAMGRLVCPIAVPCGLHIVGTERHESRRIDNQLRGRSGRQGDPGSSQFFLSISDDLMKMFMGDKMLWFLEKLGFEEGMAIEHKSVNKAIERSQKKVEERNFSIRKHLLEYDEVMDHQRKIFYQQRQDILERRGMTELIWQMIDDTLADATARYLTPTYAGECIAEWVRNKLECQIEVKKIDIDDFDGLDRYIRENAKIETQQQISITVGEYMDPDVDPSEWDIRGLTRWAESHFDATLSQNQLRKADAREIEALLVAASEEKIDKIDLTPLQPFMDRDYGKHALLNWARQKFAIEFTLEDVSDTEAVAMNKLHERVREAYRQREITYPVESILDRTIGQAGTDSAYAADLLVKWVNMKYDVGWTVDTVVNRQVNEVADTLFQLNRDYLTNGKLAAEVDLAISSNANLAEWGQRRFGPAFEERDFAAIEDGDARREYLIQCGRDLLRYELSSLEQYVLLQTFDQTWKDHMHAIDMLKESVGLRAYAEQDPKIAYKREGFRMFTEMLESVREKVTSIIFRARLSSDDNQQARSAYRIAAARHAESTNMAMATSATNSDGMAAQGEGNKKVDPIKRDEPRVGRNDACPCGSGKKFKQCHGRK